MKILCPGKTTAHRESALLLLLLSFSMLIEAPAVLAQGVGWTQMANSPGVNTVRHDDIYFTDPTNGWATQYNYIYRTTNGGNTWTTNLVLAGTHFRSIGFATTKTGFAGNLGVGSYDGGVTDTNVLYAESHGGRSDERHHGRLFS